MEEVKRMNADYKKGLTSLEVKQRIENGYDNKDTNPSTKTYGEIIRNNLFTFFNFLFTLLAVAVFLVGSYQNMLFMGVVVCNIVIGIFQEIRSKRTLDKLNLLSAHKVAVIRDSKKEEINTGELVLDDVIYLTPGNQIPADAIIIRGEVEANEALLTGEQDPVAKKEDDSLLSGSFIVSGKCYARLDKVGSESYAAKLESEAKTHKKTKSEMMKSLDRLIKIIGAIIIPFGFILFIKEYYFIGNNITQAVISTVAALVGMIPEGLYLLTTIALAVSVIKLAQNNTLVHELSSIEALARVDVLCLDKTGTITEGSMEVTGLDIINQDMSEEDIYQLIKHYLDMASDNNITSTAMKKYFEDVKLTNKLKLKKEYPFSSSRKWGGVTFENNKSYVLGAGEFILREKFSEVKDKIDKYANKGNRVLLFAEYDGEFDGDYLKGTVTPLSLILISDKIRKEARETLAFFKEQNVDIKVISGDNPVTVSNIAQKAGVDNSNKYIDAESLKTDEDIKNAVEEYTVFGRVTPNQKRKLIKAIKNEGHTVAMTGDGVNDVLAMKDADCSIAFQSGSEAASSVAQLVLLDNNFASMPKVLLEGRRVINNIERSAALFLVKNIFSFLVALVLLFFVIEYPFTPIQLTITSALTIGIPSFVLALEPTYRQIKGKFMANVMTKALPGGLTNTMLVLLAVYISRRFGLTKEEISVIATVIVGTVGLSVLFSVSMPFNTIRKILFWGISIAFYISMLILWSVFIPVHVSFTGFVIMSIFTLLSPLLLNILIRIIENWTEKYLIKK